MTRVDFYHLQTQSLESILPILAEKAHETGKNIKIQIGKEENIENINSLLWAYSDISFLPHGSKKDGFADMQPIWLSSNDDNPNQAEILFLIDDAEIDLENASKYERIVNIFNGKDSASLDNARNYWKKLKENSFELFYWQQNDQGKWLQK